MPAAVAVVNPGAGRAMDNGRSVLSVALTLLAADDGLAADDRARGEGSRAGPARRRVRRLGRLAGGIPPEPALRPAALNSAAASSSGSAAAAMLAASWGRSAAVMAVWPGGRERNAHHFVATVIRCQRAKYQETRPDS